MNQFVLSCLLHKMKRSFWHCGPQQIFPLLFLKVLDCNDDRTNSMALWILVAMSMPLSSPPSSSEGQDSFKYVFTLLPPATFYPQPDVQHPQVRLAGFLPLTSSTVVLCCVRLISDKFANLPRLSMLWAKYPEQLGLQMCTTSHAIPILVDETSMGMFGLSTPWCPNSCSLPSLGIPVIHPIINH